MCGNVYKDAHQYYTCSSSFVETIAAKFVLSSLVTIKTAYNQQSSTSPLWTWIAAQRPYPQKQAVEKSQFDFSTGASFLTKAGSLLHNAPLCLPAAEVLLNSKTKLSPQCLKHYSSQRLGYRIFYNGLGQMVSYCGQAIS